MKKIIFLFFAFAFAACDSSVTAPNLPISGSWKVNSLDATDVAKFKGTFVVDARKKTFSGTSGCNAFGATAVAIDTTAKTFTLSPIITTKIGCANDLGQFEQSYYEALRVIDSYDFDTKSNLILKEKGKTRLILAK